MLKFYVVIPHPQTGQPVVIYRASAQPEALAVAEVLHEMGCPLVGIAEVLTDVDATFDALVSTIAEDGAPNE